MSIAIGIILAGNLSCPLPVEPFTKADRKESYAVVRETCRDAGAAPVICEVAVAMAWRESRGIPHAVHDNKTGLGLFGHMPKFWRWALPTGGSFCDRVDATKALLAEFRHAARQGATTIRDLQRVHSGDNPRDGSDPGRDKKFCRLLWNGPRDDKDIVGWRVDCTEAVSLEDMGAA